MVRNAWTIILLSMHKICVHLKNSFQPIASSIVHDIMLCNISIYAQWLGIILCVVLLYTEGRSAFSYLGDRGDVVFTTFHCLNVFLFPLPLLALEIPYFVPYPDFIHKLGLCWWIIYPFGWTLRLDSFLTTLLFSITVNPTLWAGQFIFLIPGLSVLHAGIGRRGWHYLICGLMTTFWAPVKECQYYMRGPFLCLHSNMAAILAFVVTATYFIAVFLRQNHVFSRTFGGPGIEKMEFMILGVGPGYRRTGAYGDVQLS